MEGVRRVVPPAAAAVRSDVRSPRRADAISWDSVTTAASDVTSREAGRAARTNNALTGSLTHYACCESCARRRRVEGRGEGSAILVRAFVCSLAGYSLLSCESADALVHIHTMSVAVLMIKMNGCHRGTLCHAWGVRENRKPYLCGDVSYLQRASRLFTVSGLNSDYFSFEPILALLVIPRQTSCFRAVRLLVGSCLLKLVAVRHTSYHFNFET